MMRLGLPAVVAALLLLMGMAAPTLALAQSASCAMVLDASGSMRGFVSSGGGAFASVIGDLGATCSQRYAFGDRFRALSGDVGQRTFSDENTRLGEALARWRAESSSRAAIFITDNVADTGRGNSDQEAFYRGLHEGRRGFAFVTVVLARFDFDGRVFAPGATRGTNYNGPRALAFYVLAPRDMAQGAAALQSLERALRQAGLSRGGSGARSYMVISLAPLALTREQRVPIQLTGAEGAQTTRDGGGIMVNPASVNAEPSFTVSLTPRFSSDWRFREVRLGAQLQFDASDTFGPESRTDCEVDPNVLAQSALGQPVLITCRPAPLGPNLTEEQRRRLEVRGTVYREGRLVLNATVEQNALQMAGALRGWTYDGPSGDLGRDDARVQSGIYNLGALLTRMIPQQQITSEIAEAPVLQRVWLIDAGHWALIAGVLVAVAALAGLVFLALAKRDYEFTGDKNEPTQALRLRFGQAVYMEPPSGDGLVTVRVLVFGFLLTSQGRESVSPMFLSARGGRFSLGRDGVKMSVKPAPRSRDAEREKRRGPRAVRRRGGGSRR